MNGWNDDFAYIYNEYFDDVFRWTYSRTLDRQAAEDIAQDTFFAALRMGEAFLQHPEPKLWLLRTARNKIWEMYRSERRRATEPLEEESPALAEQDAHYGEIELELSATATISEEEWEMIKAHHVRGMTIAELARSETVTENNMRVRLFRFRRKLKEGMGNS